MRGVLAACLSIALAGMAQAQDELAPIVETDPETQAATILTVDIDRLFTQSDFGQRISREFNAQRSELAAENRRIAEALREEELALAEARAEMDPQVFRREAEAFDEKAQGIRRAQDAKERALEETLSVARDQFLEAARPVLGELMLERGAAAILDRRSVLLSLGSIEITEDAIASINAAIGDGTAPQEAPEQ